MYKNDIWLKKGHLNQNNQHEKHKQKEITLKNKGCKKKNSLHKKQTKRGVRTCHQSCWEDSYEDSSQT